ncbi:MAG TPA: ankyrin repeat domain-containing protein [Pusillimonas sp.]|uniref:ankyrin repeat domain-containing protein n=1 Tax=Pusillimonas sp. TaxID=3040095 RepID=UPI002CF5C305|nr:ankyrin repeat domain-containing protein [Pusillimonas sp.]HUH86745.1 ankyrin repeat domain-containing protein [Pusillimonas sp.]
MKISIKVFAACAALAVASSAWAAQANWWLDIANDRIEQVRSQLALGEDPNAVDKTGQPALMLAIQEGAWNTYDLLVRHRNINVNITNTSDETPLMYLAVIGQTKRAEALIKKGAEVNRLGWTPLHYAASKSHVDTVKLLLANKAMVNAPSPDGTSPLMMAAYAGSEEIVRILLAAGADATARNLRGEDAADWARRRNHARLAGQLDALTQRVLKSRAARAGAATSAGASAGAAASGGADPVFTLDIAEPSVPDTVRSTRDATGKSAKQPGSSEAEQDSGSSSRYFDLQRFERDDNRF